MGGPDSALDDFVGAFVDELARSGVRHVCLCPGSRSTPLALLFRRHPALKVWTHLDERSAAYFALGMAKAERSPVAVVSTSGTAAVNFAPAVVEASHARVPLLVLTADRPPELHGVGANQTIDQMRLYGSHVRWFVEMLLPSATDEAVRFARTTACRAVETASSDRPGPVHLNFPFREPLIPTQDGRPPLARVAPPADGAAGRPYVSTSPAIRRLEPEAVAALVTGLGGSERGLIVCGPQDDPDFPAAMARLAETFGFPILADPLSQVRCGSHHGPQILDCYDAFLRDEAIAEELAPEVVLRFGAAPVSRPLLQFLERHADARQVLIDPGDGWNDPLLVASDVVRTDPRWLCETLVDAVRHDPNASGGRTESQWLRRWRDLDARARTVLRDLLDSRGEMSEPGAIACLAELLRDGTTLFVGNSMPVRDLDGFFPGCAQSVRMLGNRGASGIDGVVSTALGVSAGSDGPLVLVIGDLSFCHDLNGLLAAKRHGVEATIILLNNDGGGIFSFLPQAEDPRHFEELFGTPHGLDFSHAAALYGVGYRRIDSPEEFRAAVSSGIESPGVDVIEVRTERQANAVLHRDLWDAVSRELREDAAVGRKQ